MTFTIEQLEALKEGITPGLWGVSQWEDTNRKDAEIFQYDGELLPRIGVALLKDAHAVAAVPELLDQLIAREAELQQLKMRIETLADWHGIKAMKARDFPWTGEQHEARFQGKAETHETARDKLTQILEGNQ